MSIAVINSDSLALLASKEPNPGKQGKTIVCSPQRALEIEMSLLSKYTKPQKRKRSDDVGDEMAASSTRSSPSRSAPSAEVFSPDEVSVAGNSPQVVVTGRLQGLDIHGKANQEQSAVAQPQTPRSEPLSSEHRLMNETPAKRSNTRSTNKNDSSSSSKNPSSSQRKRRKSPPLTTAPAENPLTWHDSEITGYDPMDPDDDGYGLDGIGYKPTAAVAWDRERYRERQIQDWKSREACEEREKRRERRRGIFTDKWNSRNDRNRKRVKFETEHGLEPAST
ncbi:hypothetical protein LOZ55_000655 [Ophidiomyces ophidiicola]|nr:hypothetical protein LOZ55_000655 [Ophidiomyces ophidiicola]KAI1985156.1 hypothetical protein LOZ54_004276 [Ophidiomyces ophidiicola]